MRQYHIFFLLFYFSSNLLSGQVTVEEERLQNIGESIGYYTDTSCNSQGDYKNFDFQKASSYYRTFTRDAEKNDPRLPDAYLRMADCHFLTEGYIKASEHYASAIRYKTKNADYAYFQRAECMGLLGKRDQKIKELERLIQNYLLMRYLQKQ